MNVDLQHDELETLLVCSVRYAMGRMTGIVEEVCALCRRLPLSAATMRQIVLDIDRELERDAAARRLGRSATFPLGMDVDREAWISLRDHLKNRLESL